MVAPTTLSLSEHTRRNNLGRLCRLGRAPLMAPLRRRLHAHRVEVGLRDRMPLRGCEAIQPPRLRLVLWSAPSLLVHDREVKLRTTMPLRCREANQPPRLH